MGRRTPLVCQHLENVSREVLGDTSVRQGTEWRWTS